MITKATVDRIMEATDIVEVIGEFVQLKKRGANFVGLSPFANERTPSFTVSPAKGIFKDFSSGKGGSAVTFLMELEKFTYPEALKWLAKKYGIEVEETVEAAENKEEEHRRESLMIVSGYAAKFFHESLLNTDEGKAIGLSYFKERGFTNETIAKFEQAAKGTDSDLQSYVQETLPKLREHLQHAKTAAKAVGVDDETISSLTKGTPEGVGGTGDEEKSQTGKGLNTKTVEK